MKRFFLKLVMNAMVLFARLEARVMPVSWLLSMGRCSARLMVQWLPGVRRGLFDNARHLLGPGSTHWQRRRLAIAVLTSFSRFFVELLTAPKLYPSSEELFSRLEGEEHAQAALALGKGVIGVSLHMGNFELGPAVLTERFEDIAIVYRPDPFGLVEGMRSRARGKGEARIEEITTGSPLFGVKVLNVLRRGGWAFVAGDIGFPDERAGEWFPFLDGEARFLTWPARTSLASGAPLLPCFVVYDARAGGYRVQIEPAIYPEEVGGVEEAMRRLVAVYEEYVRRYPDQWLILHRYWK